MGNLLATEFASLLEARGIVVYDMEDRHQCIAAIVWQGHILELSKGQIPLEQPRGNGLDRNLLIAIGVLFPPGRLCFLMSEQ